MAAMRHAPPNAAIMIEALRGLGYNTATALADIIDNSISAGASQVDLQFHWRDADSFISVVDNGTGMNAVELDLAMRLGVKDPLAKRDCNDLGRFGLGLKTASFSQCRRLTVSSKQHGEINTLRWDLNILATSPDDGWYLLEGVEQGSEAKLSPLNTLNNGTIVLWEVMDRIVTSGYTEKDFLALLDGIEQHLGMVFHRFLEGIRPRLAITINTRTIKPWDPFLVGHPSKPWHSPLSQAPGMPQVKAECHVLPHHDFLNAQEYLSAQGPAGWTAQQGFYVYRNQRLLVAGHWLGLGMPKAWSKDETHRLARIRVDIPNDTDIDWKIDIRKSTARPPVYLRPWLTQLAQSTRSRAVQTFASRGKLNKRKPGEELIQVWKAQKNTGGMRYQISLIHPMVSSVLEQSGALSSQIRTMLRLIEETVPVQRIWLDTAETKEPPRTGFETVSSNEVFDVIQVMYQTLVHQQMMSPALAKTHLRNMEPFDNYPELIEKLPDL
ncbi:TPA: ATP-binding protein [Yersinia enterocolitica]|nr:ATP-binding protein [Yersinia enterocolitica]HEM6615220.1 ATP-binding protein [Yersinia enterocolitica]